MTDEPLLKPVIWVGSSLKDRRAFPEPVQDHMAMPCTLPSAAAGTATPRRGAGSAGPELWK